MPAFPFQHIAILGLGLIGGSLARAVKFSSPEIFITGCNSTEKSINQALALGVVDAGFIDPIQAVAKADLIVLATPLGLYKPLLTAIAPAVKPGVVITDAGSVKAYAVETAMLALPSALVPFFVPGHPIAGSEKSGVEASSETLYDHKRVVLTPLASTNPKALYDVRSLWEACGAVVEMMEPEAHDRIYAENSHLVQLLAFAFLPSMLMLGGRAMQPVAADNLEFRRFLRLSGSPTGMWADIFTYNHRALLEAASRFRYHLESLETDIAQHNETRLKTRFTRARDHRSALQDGLTPSITPVTIGEAEVYTVLLPYLLSTVLMETIHDASYGGSGLRDFTRSLLVHSRLSPTQVIGHSEALQAALHAINQKLETLCQLIETRQPDPLRVALEDGAMLYKQAVG